VPTTPIPGSPKVALANAFTLVGAQPGQSTNANWNGTNRLMGLADVRLNTLVDNGTGRLKAAFKPYLGTGEDGVFDLPAGSATLSSDTGTASTTAASSSSRNFNLERGLPDLSPARSPAHPRPRACTIAGTINGSGAAASASTRTARSATRTPRRSHARVGGASVGGAGGYGAPATGRARCGHSTAGSAGVNLFGEPGISRRGRGASRHTTNQGGGGGGYGTAGSGGTGASNGAVVGDATFARALALFTPERSHQPNANVTGGAGGGGGGFEDDTGASETGDSGMISFLTAGGQITSGDDAGAGGGGGGGAVWVIADTLTVSGTGIIRVDGGRGASVRPAEQVLTDLTAPTTPTRPP
jgi:hypothetical protein